ncbi:MAG: DUF427 domain-containing protein [Anaerolineae bacterium]|nr:DUF427 domain-containing protein [Anaerolineae bacterium]
MSKPDKQTTRYEVLASPKWVRVLLGGEVVADSKNTLLLRAHGRLPVYYFPVEDVRMGMLEAAGGNGVAEQGEGPWPEPPDERTVYTVRAGGTDAARAAWQVLGRSDHPELEGHLAFAWQAMDAWFEEDIQVRVHPHDPYHLIDVRPSSRHVRVVIDGETVAETRRPVLLFETGLPPRHYIPKMDVRLDLLESGSRTTNCAYKGTAPHLSFRVNGNVAANIAWHYPFPNPGYEQIQDLIAFYQERVDMYVDSEPVQ